MYRISFITLQLQTLSMFRSGTLTVLAPAHAAPAALPAPRLTAAERKAQKEREPQVIAWVERNLPLGFIARHLAFEDADYPLPWRKGESVEVAEHRAWLRLERGKITWAVLETLPQVFQQLRLIQGSSMRGMFNNSGALMKVPDTRMRVRKGRRVQLPARVLKTRRGKDFTATPNTTMPFIRARGFFTSTATSTLRKVLAPWLRQLGTASVSDTWMAVQDAVRLADAQDRNHEIERFGFPKGGNRIETADGKDERMCTEEGELIPASAQAKLEDARITGPTELLLRLLSESGEVCDFTTVHEQAVMQSETFAHSEMDECVPFEISRKLRNAPSTLGEAQQVIARFFSDPRGAPAPLDDDEAYGLSALEEWVERQESVASRNVFFGPALDPHFTERAFPLDRTPSDAALPDFTGSLVVLGDAVTDWPLEDRYRNLRSARTTLRGLHLDTEDGPVFSLTTPGVCSEAKATCPDMSLFDLSPAVPSDFNLKYRRAKKDALRVPTHQETELLVSMFCASRVIIVTDEPCSALPYPLGDYQVPTRYSAALKEAFVFRGARPEIRIVPLQTTSPDLRTPVTETAWHSF